jgi:hypothetical protein
MSCGDLLIEEMSSEVVNLDEMYVCCMNVCLTLYISQLRSDWIAERETTPSVLLHAVSHTRGNAEQVRSVYLFEVSLRGCAVQPYPIQESCWRHHVS